MGNSDIVANEAQHPPPNSTRMHPTHIHTHSYEVACVRPHVAFLVDGLATQLCAIGVGPAWAELGTHTTKKDNVARSWWAAGSVLLFCLGGVLSSSARSGPTTIAHQCCRIIGERRSAGANMIFHMLDCVCVCWSHSGAVRWHIVALHLEPPFGT